MFQSTPLPFEATDSILTFSGEQSVNQFVIYKVTETYTPSAGFAIAMRVLNSAVFSIFARKTVQKNVRIVINYLGIKRKKW